MFVLTLVRMLVLTLDLLLLCGPDVGLVLSFPASLVLSGLVSALSVSPDLSLLVCFGDGY